MFSSEVMPGANRLDSIVYQSWLAPPPICAPFGLNVYQAANRLLIDGLMSNMKPWPLVAGSNQLPESKYSDAAAPLSPLVPQVAFGVSRVSGTVPARPLPSLKT